MSGREEKSVDIFGFFASETIEGQDCVSWYSGRRRTTEYCSELVTLRRRKQKKVWQQKKTGVVEKLQNLF